MNQVVLLGTIKEEPTFKQTSTGLSLANMLIEVEKAYSNSEGDIEKEIYNLTMWRQMAEDAKKRAKVGMSVGIKAHLSANNYLKDDGSISYRSEIIVDKISYI